MTAPRYNVCAVLAGAYKGGRQSLKAMLTHYEVPGTNDALCGRVKSGSLCDAPVDGPPTCKHCLRAASHAVDDSAGMTPPGVKVKEV